MAVEAINKIKQAEDTAAAILEKAVESSKDIIKKAELQGENQYNILINNAAEEVKQIKEKALEEGKLKTEPILKMGVEQVSKINNLQDETFNLAVNLVIERIVNFNGNS